MNSDATAALTETSYNHLILVYKMYDIVGKRKNINGSNVHQDLQLTPFFVTNNHHCLFAKIVDNCIFQAARYCFAKENSVP